MPTPVCPPQERLFEKTVAGYGGCLVWTAQVNLGGYARFWLNGKQVQAHRAAYELVIDTIPDGMQIDHLCHNRDASCPGDATCLHRRCVNPYHLEPVTARENVMRGNTPAAQNAAKAACVRGHVFDAANTYISPKGSRECRVCRNAASKKSHGRKNLVAAGG